MIGTGASASQVMKLFEPPFPPRIIGHSNFIDASGHIRFLCLFGYRSLRISQIGVGTAMPLARLLPKKVKTQTPINSEIGGC